MVMSIAWIIKDGRLIWSYKADDSLKTTPTIAGNRLIASGLDHYIYCLDVNDGSLIWKYKTGFEVDSSPAVIDGRIYFGGEDGYFYCLKLEDGTLVYKTSRLGWRKLFSSRRPCLHRYRARRFVLSRPY